MHIILRTDLNEKDYIKCPICGTVFPEDVEFCIYCGTAFDHSTIEKIKKDDSEN